MPTCCALIERGEPLFPGVHGYEDTVIPQIVNALLSRHNFILLGLRGPGEEPHPARPDRIFWTRKFRTSPAARINDDPLHADLPRLPRSARRERRQHTDRLDAARPALRRKTGDAGRHHRRHYRRRRSDPGRARRPRPSDELTIHYGLLPRANRGIFAINELPDLAGKIQVGLFNIMQEGDIQIKGYPVRLPLDVLLVFSANPEDYTARGKIITPLKDRIGAEIRTHYPATVRRRHVHHRRRKPGRQRDGGSPRWTCPIICAKWWKRWRFWRATISAVDKRSGVSQRLPISRARKRGQQCGTARGAQWREHVPSARIADVYSALPAITGKLELEYEGELKGAETIARELIRSAVGQSFFQATSADANFQPVVQWFELGGELKIAGDGSDGGAMAAIGNIKDLMDHVERLGATDTDGSRAGFSRGGIDSGRTVGAQANRPQRRARLFR